MRRVLHEIYIHELTQVYNSTFKGKIHPRYFVELNIKEEKESSFYMFINMKRNIFMMQLQCMLTVSSSFTLQGFIVSSVPAFKELIQL